MARGESASGHGPLWRILPACALLASGCGSSPPAAVGGGASGGEAPEAVAVQLIADVTRVAPGQEFVLAARFELPPRWHIHWENPGDSGVPTQVDFTGPDGFVVRAVRYPAPRRLELPDDATRYGYTEQVLLSAVVAAPDPLPSGPFEFQATARWLACKDACERGQGSAALVLEAANAESPSEPAHAALFTDHRAQLPVAWDDLTGVRHEWREARGQLELALFVPGEAAMELFPSSETEPVLAGQVRAPAEGATALRLLLRPGERPRRVGGVLRIASGDEVWYAAIDLPPPAAVGGDGLEAAPSADRDPGATSAR